MGSTRETGTVLTRESSELRLRSVTLHTTEEKSDIFSRQTQTYQLKVIRTREKTLVLL